ncbi:protein yellow isoform X2 [Bombyx mori]|uniref:Uncharacterized protein n=1 Tax=Bombyx mori TaxID=7091 RepID=A0A8R2M3B3_BOMMO|nr:protein yellow [Bombyx mori]
MTTLILTINLLVFTIQCSSYTLDPEASWKLFTYDIDGVQYSEDSDYELKDGAITFDEDLEDHEKFLIRKNLVPYSAIDTTRYIIFSIPRTRPGIPFSLNYYTLDFLQAGSPLINPYPSTKESREIISVYGLHQSGCRRLVWFVDTGFIDIPGAKKQVKPAEILAYASFNGVFHRYIIDSNVLQDGVTSGLKSLVVDFIYPCGLAYVYISDEYTNTIIAFSLEDKRFHKINRSAEGEAWSFPVPSSIVNFVQNVIRYRNTPKETFEHYYAFLNTQNTSNGDLVPTQKSEVTPYNTNDETYPHGVLFDWNFDSDILIFSNKNRTHLYCWNMNTEVDEKNVDLIVDVISKPNVYISSFEVLGFHFKMLLNKVRGPEPNVYDEKEDNFVLYGGSFKQLLEGTKCVMANNCTDFIKKRRASHQFLYAYKNSPKYVTDQIADRIEATKGLRPIN